MQVPIVILSYTKNPVSYLMTKACLASLHNSEAGYKFEPILIETNHEYDNIGQYENVKVVTPNLPFNYNMFLNIGFREINLTNYDYCVISNNDVVFQQGWFSEIHNIIQETGADSASPFSPGWNTHEQYCKGERFYENYEIGFGFCGWCLVFKSGSLQKLLPLDETFAFWCQDNDLAMRMDRMKMRHILVRDSKVQHLVSQSHGLIETASLFNEYTSGMIKKFHEKWG